MAVATESLMSYSPRSPILNPDPPRIDTRAFAAHLNRLGGERAAETRQYVDAVVSGSLRMGIDPLVMLAQHVLETDWSRSDYWVRNLNPAGIGVVGAVGGPSDGSKSQVWRTGTDAAYAHIAHMAAYLWGGETFARWPDTWPDVLEIDRRFPAPIQQGYVATTLGSLGKQRMVNGMWRGWSDNDPTYGQKLSERANAIARDFAVEVVPAVEPEEEPYMAFGNIPHPPFTDRLIPDIHNRAWDNLGQRKPVGVCQHSMIGSLWGTDGYFRNINTGGRIALTDYGIGNSTDGNQWDGVILRWNDPLGRATTVKVGEKSQTVSANRAGWANGGSNGLEGDGPAFVRKLGVNAINRDLVSIERSDGGKQDTAMSPKQFASICALTAHWFDVARVPWDRFPLNPEHGIVTHMLHYEFATKSCPFPPVTNRIDEIQNRVRAILKAGQTTTPEIPDQPPVGPVTPDKDWPNGWTTEQLAARFGTVMLRHPDGKETPQRFDVNGPISNGWAQKAAEWGITKVADIPPPIAWNRVIDGDGLQVDFLLFDGRGADNWMLYRPAAEVAWMWVR